jgi:hypothetical protein
MAAVAAPPATLASRPPRVNSTAHSTDPRAPDRATSEFLGDLDLALQPDKAERSVHRYHRLAASQPLAHDRDHLAVEAAQPPDAGTRNLSAGLARMAARPQG